MNPTPFSAALEWCPECSTELDRPGAPCDQCSSVPEVLAASYAGPDMGDLEEITMDHPTRPALTFGESLTTAVTVLGLVAVATILGVWFLADVPDVDAWLLQTRQDLVGW